MAIVNSLRSIRTSIGRYIMPNSAFNVSTYKPTSTYNYQDNKPIWVSLKTPLDFEAAVRFNPVVKSAINILGETASNGRKVALDINTGEVIPWTTKDVAIQKAYQLLVQRPNPQQSAKEFSVQGVFYLKTFGNRYVYINIPVGFEMDLLNVETLFNLPSQFIEIGRTRNPIYNQVDINKIISGYSLVNENPVKIFSPNEILHFNEVNISSEAPSIIGISKIEALQKPITNTNKAFEAMNTILTSRGMQGIISPKKNDGMGINIPLTPAEKKEVDEKFKADYGLLNGQNPFLFSPVNLEYFRTIMSSAELGIYEEFSNNAILIGNEFGVPPELIKTYIKGATYENQVQSLRRLYENTVMPMVADEDNYWSYKLNTAKYGFIIGTTWDHIAALQQSAKEKAIALNFSGRTAKDAYDRQSITNNEYRELIGLTKQDGLDTYKPKEEKDGNNEERPRDEEGVDE